MNFIRDLDLDREIHYRRICFYFVLNIWLRDSQEKHLLSGVKICCRATVISHLLFVDDCDFFKGLRDLLFS